MFLNPDPTLGILNLWWGNYLIGLTASESLRHSTVTRLADNLRGDAPIIRSRDWD
jgi:hypothetical protein